MERNKDRNGKKNAPQPPNFGLSSHSWPIYAHFFLTHFCTTKSQKSVVSCRPSGGCKINETCHDGGRVQGGWKKAASWTTPPPRGMGAPRLKRRPVLALCHLGGTYCKVKMRTVLLHTHFRATTSCHELIPAQGDPSPCAVPVGKAWRRGPAPLRSAGQGQPLRAVVADVSDPRRHIT